MRQLGTSLISSVMLTLYCTAVQPAAAAAPDFQEVYNLIRSNAAGVNDAELNRAAIHGLLGGLDRKAVLVTNDTETANTPIISRVAVFENDIAYLRLARVAEGAAKAVREAHQQISSTSKVAGVVLDLRYTSGLDYAAAAELADLFVGKARPLLNWGSGAVSSSDKTNAINRPVAVLVNRDTSGAAEALAAVLRETGAGLILGGQTAGHGMMTRDFPLSTGDRLRIAVAPVLLGNGEPLPVSGLKPDIEVSVRAEEEREYYADAFYVVPRINGVSGGTNNLAGVNGSRRARLNEAELVREHRSSLDRNPSPVSDPVTESESNRPVVSDPALARALDLLRGLAIVRQPRP